MIDDTSNMTPSLLRARARRYRRKVGTPGLIIVDYLQLMRSPEQENRTQEISEISRSLKALAKELGCPVVALSQLNRNWSNVQISARQTGIYGIPARWNRMRI